MSENEAVFNIPFCRNGCQRRERAKMPELIWWKAVVFKVPWLLLSQARASPFPKYLSNNLWLETGTLPPFPMVASVV